MRRIDLSLFAIALVALSASAAPASAQRGTRAGQYSSRRATVRERTLRFDLGPYERGLNDSGIILGPYDESAYGLRFQDSDTAGDEDIRVQMGLGLAYGIVDDLEIGVLAAPLNFANGQIYGDLSTYIRWAFVNESNVQFGLQGAVQFPTDTNVGFGFGLPLNINAGRVVRIETGAKVEIVFDDVDRSNPSDGDDEPRLAIDVPIALSFNIRPRGFLGGRADLLWDAKIGDADAFRAGAGAFGGFSILGSRAQYVDFTGSMMGYFRDQAFDWEFVFGSTIALGL